MRDWRKVQTVSSVSPQNSGDGVRAKEGTQAFRQSLNIYSEFRLLT